MLLLGGQPRGCPWRWSLFQPLRISSKYCWDLRRLQNAVSIAEAELKRTSSTSFFGMLNRGPQPNKLNMRLRAALELATCLKDRAALQSQEKQYSVAESGMKRAVQAVQETVEASKAGLGALGNSASAKDQQTFDKLTGVYIDLKFAQLECLETLAQVLKSSGAAAVDQESVASQINALAQELTVR